MTTSRAHELVPITLCVRSLSQIVFGASERVPAPFGKMLVTTQVANPAEGGIARGYERRGGMGEHEVGVARFMSSNEADPSCWWCWHADGQLRGALTVSMQAPMPSRRRGGAGLHCRGRRSRRVLGRARDNEGIHFC